MSKKCDLHIHSIFSDGEKTPEEIVTIAKKAKMDVISITDHNSVDGVERGLIAAKKEGIELIPGVELSTRHGKERVHILGYFSEKDYKNTDLIKALKCVKRKNAFKINKILDGKIKIKNGSKRLSVEEGIKLLKLFKGTVILAHPVKLNKRCLKEIINMDFDGIEGIRPENNEKDDIFFKEICKEKGYILTGGSDFHTDKKNDCHSNIGSSYVKTKNIKKLLKIKSKN